MEQIFQNRYCRERISPKTIESQLFKWMEERYIGSTNLALSDYLEDAFSLIVKKCKVYVPIARTVVESEFKIGRVTIQPLSADIITGWQKVCPSIPAQSEAIDELFNETRRRIQGYAVGMVQIEAEPDHANNVCIEVVEKALSLLRVFSPANVNPSQRCKTAVKGKEYIPQTETIVLSEDNINLNSGLLDKGNPHWEISKEFIDLMLSEGLSEIGELLKCDTKTSFQDKVLNALMIYSKSSLEPEPETKLIYIFSAIESLLLRNEGEPIQQNVGERMSFIVASDVVQRKRIIQVTKAAYKLRSRFFHHGHSMDDIEAISEFMECAWSMILKTIKLVDAFNTKDEFLDEIEHMKLS